MNQPLRPLERMVDRSGAEPEPDAGWSISHTGHLYGCDLVIFPMGADRAGSWNIRLTGERGTFDGVFECSIEEAQRLARRVAKAMSESEIPF